MEVERNLPFSSYLARPEMSVSELLDRRRSLAYAEYRKTQDSGSRFTLLGSAWHCLVIEADEFASRYRRVDVCSATLKNGKPCTAPGKYVGGVCGRHGGTVEDENALTADEWARCHAMADSARGALTGMRILDAEASWFWGGRRARPDLVAMLPDGRKAIVDLKSEGDIERAMTRQAYAGVHVRAAWYMDADPLVDCYVICLTASDAPHETFLYEITEAQVAAGRIEIERLLDKQDPTGLVDMPLPGWVTSEVDREDDDISDMGLEFGDE